MIKNSKLGHSRGYRENKSGEKKKTSKEKYIFANIVLMADSSGVKQCWREQCNKMFYEL